MNKQAHTKLDINIVKADGIGGFGAWLAGYQKENGKGIILSEEKKRILIETLIHEFAHALEEFFGAGRILTLYLFS